MEKRLIANLVGAFIILSIATVSQGQSIEVDFTADFVVFTGRAQCCCIVQNVSSISSLSWEHNGTVVQGSQDRISIRTDVGNCNSLLEIDDIKFRDAGEYTCIVIPGIGGRLQGSDTLQVATPLIVNAEPEQEATEGETAELRCTANSFPVPQITWFRVVENSDGIPNEIRLLIQSHSDQDFGVFRITNVTRGDAGLYVCEGDYSFGSERTEIVLTVLTVPEITSEELENLIVLKGEELQLDCNATGVREPTYSWEFNEEEINSTIDPRAQVDETTGELVVRDVTFDDAGNYTCVAVNQAGNDTQLNTVLVAGSPEIVTPNNTEVLVGAGTVGELPCQFVAFPPPDTVWFQINQNGLEELESNPDGRYSVLDNGTLLIQDVQTADAGMYLCNVSNEHGSDTRVIILTIIEPPVSPRNLSVVETGSNSESVTLMWEQPDAPSANRMVEEFVVELSEDDMGFEQVESTFAPDRRRGLVDGLIPGTSYRIRLQASNLGGLSEPSNVVQYLTPRTPPRLAFFNATALEGGRSVLLQWELEFTGGAMVTTFTVNVFRDGMLIEPLELDISLGRFVLTDLNATTEYRFIAQAMNLFGTSEPIDVAVTTTLAPPDRPTKPQVASRSTRTLSLSFSVNFGSRPITLFILNTTELDSNPAIITQLNFSSDDPLLSLSNILNDDGETKGYDVELEVTGLSSGEEYVFIVAAANEIGVGEFSEPSDPISLEEEDRIFYYIVAGVAGGVVTFILAIIVVVAIAFSCKRKARKGRKMTITDRGSDYNGSDFTFSTPKHQVSDSYIGNVDRESIPSPHYNSLGKFQNGGQSLSPDVMGVDEPDSHFRPIPYPRYQQQSPLGHLGPSTPRGPAIPHNSFNNLAPPQRNYPDSVVSDKQLGSSAPVYYSTPALSRSTPMVNRYSYDVDNLPNTSYQTDV